VPVGCNDERDGRLAQHRLDPFEELDGIGRAAAVEVVDEDGDGLADRTDKSAERRWSLFIGSAAWRTKSSAPLREEKAPPIPLSALTPAATVVTAVATTVISAAPPGTSCARATRMAIANSASAASKPAMRQPATRARQAIARSQSQSFLGQGARRTASRCTSAISSHHGAPTRWCCQALNWTTSQPWAVKYSQRKRRSDVLPDPHGPSRCSTKESGSARCK
jgi:hypothetical protein